MDSVGVRELRQNASKVLDRVKSGEVIEVTERGNPVAFIAPIADSSREVLIQAGLLTPAVADARHIAVPSRRLPRGTTTARALDELGADRL